MIRFLLVALSALSVLSAQQPAAKPESAPTSRPLRVIAKELALTHALNNTYAYAAGKRLDRTKEIGEQYRDALSDLTKNRLAEEMRRIADENSRYLPRWTEVEAERNRLIAEFDAWGVEHVRRWWREECPEIPGMSWRYFDAGQADVTYELLGGWYGFRVSAALFGYVGDPTETPTAVRTHWRGLDAFGDPVALAETTLTFDLDPDAPMDAYRQGASVLSDLLVKQATEAQARPTRKTVRIRPSGGRSVRAR